MPALPALGHERKGDCLVHDSQGGCAGEHRFPVAARRRAGRNHDACRRIGDLGTRERVTRDATVHRCAGWSGRMLYPAGNNITATTYQVNLLDTGDLYGEGYFIADLKLAKNFRFSKKRLTVGVDVYNLFNTDAVRAYEPTFPGTAAGVAWGSPTVLLSPRFARLQVNFDF